MAPSARPRQRRTLLAATEVKRTVCTHCSVGCSVDATVENGVWTRQEPVFDSPLNLGAHCAKGASVREHGMHEHSHRLEVADEARRRQVPEDQLGAGDQRGGRQAPRAEKGIGAGRRVLGRQLEAQQRAVVPAPQVRVVLGHEQLRPPGPDLPLDDGRRRSQHLGLRRDDQLVQRHAEHEVRDVHRQQRGRSAPGVDAAHAAREGNRREDDRRRSALHAYRGEGRRIRAHPFGIRHRVPVRHAVSHLQERLGGQAVHQRPRLRDGKGQGRRDGQVDSRQGRGSLRRARGAGFEGRRDDGEEPAVDRRMVHGPDAAHDRQRDRARVVHPPARARQRRGGGRRHQHLPRDTTTSRARPTSARIRIRCRATTASPRARGGTTPRSGASTTSGSRSSTPKA